MRLSQKAVEHARAARKVGTPHPSQILDLKVCDPAMGSGAFLVEACRQLGDELIKAWHAHDAVPSDLPPDEDEVLYARRLVAQRCLYGVDKNFMAVDLAKLALWLVTLARDHAFTFLDHALRHGDSLVGLSREQIIGFHWEPKKQQKFGEDLIQRRLDRATEARAKILNAREDVAYRDQEQKMALAEEALSGIRLLGDACVSAFFAGKKKKEREDRVDQLFGIASAYLEKLKDKQRDFELHKSLQTAADSLLEGEHPIPAFHWEIEFPEVFARENAGFDAFVGNPPFLGGRRISTYHGDAYFSFINETHQGAGNLCDLVAYFFRRSFELIREEGSIGLIATNTISQGDTRRGGLEWICSNEGTIYNVRTRVPWEGVSVVACCIHISKSVGLPAIYLDCKLVPIITPFLLAGGPITDPHKFPSINALFSKGTQIYGLGFLFDDSSEKSTPVVEMDRIVQQEPQSRGRILRYLGGEDINWSPSKRRTKFVIYFSDIQNEGELAEWPELARIVREKVKPERDLLSNSASALQLKKKWWAYQAHRPKFYAAAAELERVLAQVQVSPHLAFSFLPTDAVFSKQLNLFVFNRYVDFAVMQSRCHEVWARLLSSTSIEMLSYAPSDCFQTFPFPLDNLSSVETAGSNYYVARENLIVKNDEGLTEIYNRFHDPHEKSSCILELRRLHAEMDQAVLRAYGWDDLAETATCEFLLDYEEEEDDSPTAKKSKKKMPWRLRWPDEFRDEVLARLLELNEQRHQEELLLAKKKEGEKGSGGDGEKARKSKKDQCTPLLDDQ